MTWVVAPAEPLLECAEYGDRRYEARADLGERRPALHGRLTLVLLPVGKARRAVCETRQRGQHEVVGPKGGIRPCVPERRHACADQLRMAVKHGCAVEAERRQLLMPVGAEKDVRPREKLLDAKRAL